MSPIPQMEGLDHRIHAGFGHHLAGARAFHFKGLSICVICVIGGFNSLFRMKGSDVPSERPDAGNLDENEVSTNQQALPVPLFAGEASFALQWLCDPYNQFTREAPAERPGKK